MNRKISKLLNTKSLKINAVFNGLYQILVLLVPFITTPYISRIFGPGLRGDYAYYTSIVSYFTILATFGFNDFGTKIISQNRNNKEEKTKAFLGIRYIKFFLSLLTILIYLAVIIPLFRNDRRAVFSFLLLTFNIIAIQIDPTFYFQGEERFVSICIRNITIRILTIVLIFVCIRSSDDFLSYVGIRAIGNVVSSLIIYFSFKKGTFSSFKYKLKELRIRYLLFQSFSYFIPALAVSLFMIFNQTLLGIIGKDSTQNGYYSQAIKVINIITGLCSSLNVIILSRMSYLYSTHNKEEREDKLKKAIGASLSIALPCLFGIVAIASEFIPLFLGSGYEETIPVLYILSPIIITYTVNGFLGYAYYRPSNHIWTQTWITFGIVGLNVCCNLLLIPKYKATGCAIATLITEYVERFFLIWFARKAVDPKILLNAFIQPFDASLIMFLGISLLSKVIGILPTIPMLFMKIIVGILIYSVLALFFRIPFIIMRKNVVLNYIKNHIFKRKGKVKNDQ